MISKKKPVDYVNNVDLVTAILVWQSLCRAAEKEDKPWPQISDYIGKCILQICNGLASRYNFNNYSYRDEFISDGVEKCLNAIKNFNPQFGTAFNYLSQVAFKAFQYRILVERKQQYVKHKYYVHRYTIADVDGQIHEGTDNEYTNKVIDEYETKHLNKQEQPKKDKRNVNKKSAFDTTVNSGQSRIHFNRKRKSD